MFNLQDRINRRIVMYRCETSKSENTGCSFWQLFSGYLGLNIQIGSIFYDRLEDGKHNHTLILIQKSNCKQPAKIIQQFLVHVIKRDRGS